MSREHDEKPINQNTAAERDDLFITQHPLDGRTVQLGAAFTGATEAVIKAIDETKELLDKTIEPGDMNPAHIPHSVDDAIKLVVDITEPRDMRIENSPHPKDKITAAIHSKFEEIKQAGVIEGTRISAAVVVGATIDMIGPSGKAKTGSGLIDGFDKAESALRISSKLDWDNTATNAFLREAVSNTGYQLKNAANEYARTAQAAKTFGTEFNRYKDHDDALVRFEIASIKLDALKYGGDASNHNPVIADLLKNGKDSTHFYAKNIMDEISKFDANLIPNLEQAAIVQATKLAHSNRLKLLSEIKPNDRILTLAEQMELKVGSQYGADAAAHARMLMRDGEIEKVNTLYPHRNNQTELTGTITKTPIKATNNVAHEHSERIDSSKFNDHSEHIHEVFKIEEKNIGKDRGHESKNEPISLNDAISHLPLESQRLVLASIQEKIAINNQQLNGPELT